MSAFLEPLLAVLGTVFAAMLLYAAQKGLEAFQARTGIILTAHQREVVLGAVRTAAGVIETRLDQGALKVADIDARNLDVRQEARAAMNAVPVASAALGMTVEGVARIVVGMIDTSRHGLTTAVTTATPDKLVTTTTPG